MVQTDLKNGMVKLTDTNGIKDKRDGKTYSEVVVKASNVKYFVSADEESADTEYVSNEDVVKELKEALADEED